MVERQGAQGAVGEGCEGGAERSCSQPDAGCCAERAGRCCLGRGASLRSGAQGGGGALRSGGGAVQCSGGESRESPLRGRVPMQSRRLVAAPLRVIRCVCRAVVLAARGWQVHGEELAAGHVPVRERVLCLCDVWSEYNRTTYINLWGLETTQHSVFRLPQNLLVPRRRVAA